MEGKKVLNNEELEKVSGGLGSHKSELDKSSISDTSIPRIDMNEVPDNEVSDATDKKPTFNKSIECGFGAPAIIK